MASADVGRLRGWSLTVAPISAQSVAINESPGIAIPDNQVPGLVRTIQCNITGGITALTVDVDITHTYIGDLTVALTAPGGQRVVLHNREGGDTDNLIRSWSTATAGALTSFVGVQANGTWKLEVTDHEPPDSGKLNRWRLAVTVA